MRRAFRRRTCLGAGPPAHPPASTVCCARSTSCRPTASRWAPGWPPPRQNLYEFWGERITDELNRLLARGKTPGARRAAEPRLRRYFKSVKPKKLEGRIVTRSSRTGRAGATRSSALPPSARGLMSRYVITNRIDEVEALQGFAAEGYAFAAEASDADSRSFAAARSDRAEDQLHLRLRRDRGRAHRRPGRHPPAPAQGQRRRLPPVVPLPA